MIRTERRRVQETDLQFDCLTGPTLTKEIMTEFYQLYLDTYGRYEEQEFLTPAFFLEVQKRMPSKAMLNTVRRDGQFLAGTLLFQGDNMVFAHHWGCKEHIKFLHFETTYYKAVDYCFDHNKQAVNAGQGGNHKANRGFLPFTTYHAHWFRSQEFQNAVGRSIGKKKKMVDAEIAKSMAFSPYKDDKA